MRFLRYAPPRINRPPVIENRLLHFVDVILPVFREQRREGEKGKGGMEGSNETIPRNISRSAYAFMHKTRRDGLK